MLLHTRDAEVPWIPSSEPSNWICGFDPCLFIWHPLQRPRVPMMVEDHVDYPYADGAPDCSCYSANGCLEADNGTADADSGYSAVEVNRNLARATLEVAFISNRLQRTGVVWTYYEKGAVARTQGDRIARNSHTWEVGVLGGSLDENLDASS